MLRVQDSDSRAWNESRIQLSDGLFEGRACGTDCTVSPVKLPLMLVNFAWKKMNAFYWWKIMLLWTLIISMYLFKSVLLLSSDTYPRVELLDRRVILFLVFWGIFILFPIMATPFSIPTSSSLEFLFLHLFTSNLLFVVVVVVVFWQQPFWQVCSDISLWFWFVFPWWLVTLSILACVCWPWKQKRFRNSPCLRNSDSHGAEKQVLSNCTCFKCKVQWVWRRELLTLPGSA